MFHPKQVNPTSTSTLTAVAVAAAAVAVAVEMMEVVEEEVSEAAPEC